jgi:hypothetical protein
LLRRDRLIAEKGVSESDTSNSHTVELELT